MLIKCRKCRGKGGWVPTGSRVRVHVYITCVECRGKGKWDTSKRSKQKKNL